MPKFADYKEETAPAGSDILLIDNRAGSSTRKLSIANLLRRGTSGTMAKFSAQNGLADSQLSEKVVGASSHLLYNLSEPIITGGTGMHAAQFKTPATVSIRGNIAARATNAEFSFENNWHNQNTMSIRNTYVGNGSFSTLRVLARDGYEMGSFGYGNTAATPEETAAYPWYEGIYIETGNPNRKFLMRDVAGNPFPSRAPSPLRFIQSGVIPQGWLRNRPYFYVRQEFVPSGDVHFYDVSEPFNRRVPVVKIGWDGRFHVMPRIGGDAMVVQNRLATELSTIKFLRSGGQAAGAFGFGNAESRASELQNTFYLLMEAGSLDEAPPPFVIMQTGRTPGEGFFKTRLSVGASGRIAQSVLTGAPADSEIEKDQVVFYIDEAASALMARVRLGDGTFRTGQIAALR